MEFIALQSDELDMNYVSSCLENIGNMYIAENENELIEKIKTSIENVQFYKALFIYPSKNSKSTFEIIKEIRKLEKNIEYSTQVIIFTDNDKGIHLLSKLSYSSEKFISSKLVKRKILEAVMQ